MADLHGRLNPATTTGVSQTLWTMEDVAERIEIRTAKPRYVGAIQEAGNGLSLPSRGEAVECWIAIQRPY